MTVGTGIFLSSIVVAMVVLYGITKDRWNWRRVLTRMGLGIVALVLLGLGAFGAYYLLDRLPSKVSRQTEYAGIRLGATPDEVMYIKGYPPTVLGENVSDPNGPWKDFLLETDTAKLEKGKTVTDYRYWLYKADRSRITIEFDKGRTGAVTAIQCYSDDKLYRCPSIAGVRDGDSEQEAVRRLGPAGEQKFQGAAKSISYPELGIRLHLTQEQVYMMQVNTTGATGLLVPTGR